MVVSHENYPLLIQQFYRESLRQVRLDHNSKMADGTGEELKMVSTFFIQIFGLEIIWDGLSRTSLYSEVF